MDTQIVELSEALIKKSKDINKNADTVIGRINDYIAMSDEIMEKSRQLFGTMPPMGIYDIDAA